MKAIVKSIVAHPFTVILYIFYWLLILNEIDRVYAHRELQKTLKPGELLPHLEWGGVLQFIVAIIFGLVMGVNAITRKKDQMWFYLCMIVLIIVPLVVMVNY